LRETVGFALTIRLTPTVSVERENLKKEEKSDHYYWAPHHTPTTSSNGLSKRSQLSG
jgi:hypothetical protein